MARTFELPSLAYPEAITAPTKTTELPNRTASWWDRIKNKLAAPTHLETNGFAVYGVNRLRESNTPEEMKRAAEQMAQIVSGMSGRNVDMITQQIGKISQEYIKDPSLTPADRDLLDDYVQGLKTNILIVSEYS